MSGKRQREMSRSASSESGSDSADKRGKYSSRRRASPTERHRDQQHNNNRRDDDRHHNNNRSQQHQDDERHSRRVEQHRGDDRSGRYRGGDDNNHRTFDNHRRGGGGGGGGGGGRGFHSGRRNNQNDNDRDYNSRRRNRSRSNSFDHANAKWGKNQGDHRSDKKDDSKSTTEKEKPNFGLSGKLTEERNTYKGVIIKYSEPPEAKKPKRRWRLYPFKGEKALQTLYIHRESAYLIGRDRKVVDLPVDHPSCSKQHAAIQYRLVSFTRLDGSTGKRVRPYLIDLESANGTFINNKKIDAKKYVELIEKDVIKFGFSSREYVLLHENSKDEDQDDDVKPDVLMDDEVVVKQQDNEEEIVVKQESV